MSIVEKEIRKIKEKLLDYSGYGLDRNPFPSSGISPDTANIEDIRKFLNQYFCEKIREQEIKTLVRGIVRAGYIDKTAGHMWLWGDWRVGKSALLMRLFVALHDELQDSITIYVPKPRYGLTKSIFYYFIREYPPDFFNELFKKTLVKTLTENPNLIEDDWIEIWKEQQEELKGKTIADCRTTLVEEIKNNSVDVFSLIGEEAIDPHKLYDVCVASLVKEGLTEDVISIFTDTQLDPEARYRKISELENKKNYADQLVALFTLCHLSGYQHTFVFIDDVEDVVRLWTRGKAEKEIDELNNFLDRMHEHLSLLGTMHSNLFPIFEERYPRFVGRASADPLNFSLVQVKPLESKEYLVEVVSQLLSRARKVTPPYPTYPFKEDVLEDLHKSLDGKLGLILPSLYNLLRKGAEQGTEKGSYPEIDMEFYQTRKKETFTEVSS